MERNHLESEEFFDAVDHSEDEEKEASISEHTSQIMKGVESEIQEIDPEGLKPLTLVHRRSVSSSELGFDPTAFPREQVPYSPRKPVLKAQSIGTAVKSVKEFEGLVQVQEIVVSTGEEVTIWVAKFSPTARFLAVSGQHPSIFLYEVSTQGDGIGPFPLFCQRPYGEYLGHTRPVVDLSWSKSGTHFISASMDRSVILWNVASVDQLIRFSHPDIVSAVCFNPYVPFTQNANFFISGCFDKMIRVWNIPQERVEACYQTPDLVTAVTCSSETHLVAVGLRLGLCIIYEASPDMKMKFLSQVDCKNRKGRKSKGRKVTGIEFLDETSFLVTTNDSRTRLMNLQDFTMKQKYKGNRNEQAPIKATFSHNFVHVICGSDNGNVYIWNTYNTYVPRIKYK